MDMDCTCQATDLCNCFLQLKLRMKKDFLLFAYDPVLFMTDSDYIKRRNNYLITSVFFH